jgi:hypothetical protein
MVIEARVMGSLAYRSETTAAFVSQMLAARENTSPHRQHLRVQGAVGAYRAGASISVVRMPQGYRKTVLA